MNTGRNERNEKQMIKMATKDFRRMMEEMREIFPKSEPPVWLATTVIENKGERKHLDGLRKIANRARTQRL